MPVTSEDIVTARKLATTPQDSIQRVQDYLRRVVDDWERQQRQITELQRHNTELLSVNRELKQRVADATAALDEIQKVGLDLDMTFGKLRSMHGNALVRITVGDSLTKDGR